MATETSLDERRQIAADAAFEQHQQPGIVDADGWEWTTPGVEMTRTIYAESLNDPDGPSIRGHFTVVFASDSSAKIVDAYAAF